MERAKKLEAAKNGDMEVPPMTDEAMLGMLEFIGVLKPKENSGG